MPLYEYVCQKCDRESELLVTSGEPPVCPECGSAELAKLLSVVASPARDGASAGPERPAGPCGSACGCFPSN